MKKSELREIIMEEIQKLNEARMVKRYKVGDMVTMTDDALDNYGKKYKNKKFKITHVATSQSDHPGFDDVGYALYDFKGVDSSLYDYELN